MGKAIDYRFRVRENDGRKLVRPHIKKVENECVFSKPGTDICDKESHVTIKRPPFKELEGAARKYLDEKDNSFIEEKETNKILNKIKKLMK